MEFWNRFFKNVMKMDMSQDSGINDNELVGLEGVKLV
jgi:hypothetical protein